MSRYLSIAAYVIVPMAWGVFAVFTSNRIDRWIRRLKKPDNTGNIMSPHDPSRIEYHI